VNYYQKYRPQKIEDLDLTDVRDNLLGAVKGGGLSHAYLFVGPRGAGKTSAARILAQVVNCETSKETKLSEPCGKCKACLNIRVGSEVDVLEMDAASHRGIDDIRNLKERIKLTPVRLRKKVYIIDEVHMLTREAFNALLKVLEEPPKHVMFFLCTTEEHKVPETIISRCAKVTFSKASVEEVEASLMKVVKGEGLKINKKAIKLLSESVDGSFREGHKLLQQLGGKSSEIGEKEITRILGLAGGKEVEKLLEAGLQGRSKEIGGIIEKMEGDGVSASSLLETLLKELRGRIRRAVEAGEEIRKMTELTRLLIESAERLSVSPVPFLPIELCLLEVALNSDQENGGRVKEREVEVTSEKKRSEVETKVKSRAKVEEKEEVKEAGDLSTQPKMNGNILDFSKIEEEWGKLLEKLSSKNRSVAGLLRASKPKLTDGNSLTVEVFYEFHKNQLEQDSKRILVERAAAELWGPTVLRCVLGEKQIQERVETEDRVVEIDKDNDYVKAAEDVFGN
jgi:DNA polymerase III subunit gamma/tau